MPSTTPEKQADIIYFSHGGGPLPILGEPSHTAMVNFMKELPNQIHKPEAVIVISAHWEEDKPTVTGHATPSMVFDYFGFPRAAYEIDYPAPGHPELAKRVANLLQQNDIPSDVNPFRGFDHGLFIPLMMMYPDAELPMIQLSLRTDLDPAAHIQLGKALAPLKSEKILVIGSGFSFHNMKAFSLKGGNQTDPEPDPENDAFQDWLIDTCAGSHSPEERERLLSNWESAPAARYCHPREEHLLPLHVCAGMAGSPADVIFDDFIIGKRSVAFQW